MFTVDLNPKRILITGGAGYIGSHLTHRLCCLGHQVTVIDNLSTGFKQSLPIEKINFNYIDLRNTIEVQKHFLVHQYDYIIHLAGSLNVAESVKNPLEYYENNILSLTNILKSLNKNYKTKFIFSSTCSIYGKTNNFKPFDEETLPEPINPYAESKLICEKILSDYKSSRTDFDYIILRYFNVAAAADDLSNGQRTAKPYHLLHLAALTALALINKSTPTQNNLVSSLNSMSIFGHNFPTIDGTCIRDFLHVEDLVDAHLKSIDFLNINNESHILNCGYANEISVLQAINTMKTVTKTDFSVNLQDPRPGDPIYLVADNKKIQNILNWKPRRDLLPDICLSAFNWEKKYQSTFQKTVATVHS